jgi:4-hydroxybenzoate polyprenyltransferase
MRIATVRLFDIPQFIFTNRLDVCLMAVFLTIFWNSALKLPLPIEYYLMIFFTTLGGYAYNMYTDKLEDDINYNSKYRLFDSQNAFTKYFIISFFLIGFVLALPAGFWFVLYGGLTHLLAAMYSTPIKVNIFNKKIIQFRIKNIPFIKNLYVAFFWSAGLICTPFLYLGEGKEIFSRLVLIILIASFGLNYFLELMWDLRDICGDKKANVNTVPIVMGERFTFALLILVHIGTCLLIIQAIMLGILPTCYWIVLIHLFLGICFLSQYSRTINKELMSHLYLLYAGIIITLSIIWTNYL